MIEIYTDLANVLGNFDIQFNQGFLEEQLCKKYSTKKFTFKGEYNHVVTVKSSDIEAVTEVLKLCPDVTKTKTYPRHNNAQRFLKVLFKGVPFTFIARERLPSVNNKDYGDVFGKRATVATYESTVFKLMMRTLRNSKMDDALLPALFEMVAASSNTTLFQHFTKQAENAGNKIVKVGADVLVQVNHLMLMQSADIQIAELLDLYFVKFKNNPKNIVDMYLYLKKINWPTVRL